MNPLDKSWEFIKAKRIKDQPGYNLDRKKIARRAEENRERENRSSRYESPSLASFSPLPSRFPDNPKLRAEIEAKNKKAKANLEAEAEGPKYPNPPMSEPSQSNLVSSTGINDPHDPRTMQPRRGA
jgi:hypothetical protein